MDSNRSRTGVLVGLGAAAGAFGIAAMMSAATAPTARADDFTDLISSLGQDFSQGQPEFASAFADFGSGDPSDGLAALFSGLDDDVEGPADTFYKATVDVLLNEPFGNISYGFGLDGIPVPDIATGVAYLENDVSGAEGEFAQAAMDLASGDYGDAADQQIQGLTSLVFGAQFLLEGVASSLSTG
jgi:hypothetical protein